MSIFQYRFISKRCLDVAIIALIFAFKSPILLSILAIGMFIAFLVINGAYWRCPKCQRQFQLRSGPMDKMTYCPFCAHQLREEKRG